MPPKLPLPRGWKRRVRPSFLSDMILNLLDSTTNMPFLGRPKSVVQYTACWCRLIHPASISITSCPGEHHDFDFMGAILLRTTAGNAVAERPKSAGIR